MQFKIFTKLALLFFIGIMNASVVSAQESRWILSSDPVLKVLRPENITKLNSFFQQTIEKLPAQLTHEISNKLHFSFTNFNASSLNAPFCQTHHNLEKRDLFEIQPANFIDAQRFETLNLTKKAPHYLIKLNSNYIQVILEGEQNTKKYECGHRNLYRYAQAVVVREIARLYDDLNKFPKTNIYEQNLIKSCAFIKGPFDTETLAPECREFLKWKHSISDRPMWRNLRHLQNQTDSKILSEDFARHFEFYILDQDFACRKPAVNDFLNKYFLITKQNQCPLNFNVPVNLASAQMNLDINRLYQIHILLADPGEKMESRWGHVMFRLVFCNPLRASTGPECLKDIDSHLVVGFLGAPGTILTSNWDGIRGKYPSILSIQPYATALNEYTVKESRTLTSIPLKLNQDEKKLFVYRTLEDFWAYQGHYLFFTNNCATEARNFLQGILKEKSNSLHDRKAIFESPTLLFEYLISNGYANNKVLKSKAERDNYIIKSPRQQWNKDAGQSLLAELLSLDAEQRRQHYENKIEKNPENIKKIAITYYEVELEIYAYLKAKKDLILQSFVLEDQNNLNGEYTPLIHLLQWRVTLLSPKYLVAAGYGIPLPSDFLNQSEIDARRTDLRNTTKELETLLRRDRPDIYQALTESNNNMKYFFNDIKRANTAKN